MEVSISAPNVKMSDRNRRHRSLSTICSAADCDSPHAIPPSLPPTAFAFFLSLWFLHPRGTQGQSRRREAWRSKQPERERLLNFPFSFWSSHRTQMHSLKEKVSGLFSNSTSSSSSKSSPPDPRSQVFVFVSVFCLVACLWYFFFGLIDLREVFMLFRDCGDWVLCVLGVYGLAGDWFCGYLKMWDLVGGLINSSGLWRAATEQNVLSTFQY